jgi:hypothetical protein
LPALAAAGISVIDAVDVDVPRVGRTRSQTRAQAETRLWCMAAGIEGASASPGG